MRLGMGILRVSARIAEQSVLSFTLSGTRFLDPCGIYRSACFKRLTHSPLLSKMSQPPILLYTYTTPNGFPISIHLEELKAAYPTFGGYESVIRIYTISSAQM
jgi:hypothetical protein